MSTRATPELPFVSVLMPIRNEAAFIRRSLGAVLAQDYPADRLEVLVADGESDDGTRELVAELGDASPFTVRVIDNPGRIVATGLNAALEVARGDVIVRVDGHTIIATDYVSECVRALQRTAADNVGGRMIPAGGETPFAAAVAVATTCPFGTGGARFHYATEEERVDTVYMGAWPRATFERFGTFDEDFVRNQDDELNYRIRKGGGEIVLSPRIRSTYFPRTSPRALWRQYFSYGDWKVRVLRKHPSEGRFSHLAPPAFAGAVVAGAALSPFSRLARIGLAAVLAPYLAANLMATFAQRRRTGTDRLALLPGVFLILHLAYGLGFLTGLARQLRCRHRAP